MGLVSADLVSIVKGPDPIFKSTAPLKADIKTALHHINGSIEAQGERDGNRCLTHP
ncbi:hypothetical protein JHL21_05990 [Devosia sp. WQ 349]|uniref:hypothetical protein n=1 Tax=Devosia sp. WQ 349K1 TaxID=2800329 RepID=UPI001908E807|nr:hypothetical protein [Devosia sp. WQ 349K1]MBK1794047.1 hypothetical protein [Devosia sp. WQ 349K1]